MTTEISIPLSSTSSTSSQPPVNDHGKNDNDNDDVGFFSLPPELRNRIYRLAFPCCINNKHSAYNPVLHYRYLEPCVCFQQPLMRVSRQMRREAVGLHYGAHEFHFMLFPPNRAALLSWLGVVVGEWVASIRKFQLKRYVSGGKMLFRGEQIKIVSVDLGAGEIPKVEMRVSGQLVEVEEGLEEILLSLPVEEGRRVLTREKLVEMFDTLGWH